MALPHVVLGTEPDADFATVKRAYMRLAMQHHPDKGGDVAEFERVKTAYEALRAKHLAQGLFDDIIDAVAKENKA